MGTRLRASWSQARELTMDEDYSVGMYGVADLLVKQFDDVIVVISQLRIASKVNPCSTIGMYRRLYNAEVESRTAQQTLGFDSGVLHLQNPYSGQETIIEDIDMVVYATPWVVRDGIARLLDGLPVHLTDDRRSPRELHAVIQSEHLLAETL